MENRHKFKHGQTVPRWVLDAIEWEKYVEVALMPYPKEGEEDERTKK